MWLGHNFKSVDGQPLGPTPKEMPFDRAVWAQWRCYWPFGGGMFTDLFVHQTTHMIAAMGVRFPARVVGGGGIYLEYDGRDVPDVATVVADYDEGCQFIVSATMCNDTQLGEMIRGHLATIKFTGGGDYIKGFEVYGQNIAGGPAKPKSDSGRRSRSTRYENPSQGAGERRRYALWENFLECVRDQQARDAQHAGTRRRRVHHGEHGRAELPLRQGAVLGQGEAGPEGRRRHVGGAVGSPQQEARQAEPDHRLERPATRAALLTPPDVPEARRPVGRRQGPGGGLMLFADRRLVLCPSPGSYARLDP